MIQALLRQSRKNAGVLADCMVEWLGAETPKAKVAVVRVAEVINQIHVALKGK